MDVLDLAERREARRRAEMDRFLAWHDREIAAMHRILDQLQPVFDDMLAHARKVARRPRCEAPKCPSHVTTLQAVAGRTAADAPALIRLCSYHLREVIAGRIRIRAGEGHTLTWQLCDGPDAKPRAELTLPRKKPRGKRSAPS